MTLLSGYRIPRKADDGELQIPRGTGHDHLAHPGKAYTLIYPGLRDGSRDIIQPQSTDKYVRLTRSQRIVRASLPSPLPVMKPRRVNLL